MSVYTQEDKILLAIKAIRSARAAGQKPSVLCAVKTYGVPESSVRYRVNDRPRRVIKQDSRGFPLRLASVEYIANLLLGARNGEPFILLRNKIAKYKIKEGNIYNFDKTSFIVGVITILIVAARTNQRSKVKSV
ncbi:transposase [Colletotrichum sojae]|uniref:Transposase n=1 Tax=Colletotrichum sojae TaxID=2175907 RepID=A0A8H6IL44_9PEZI|nr:transposase [Colletotrichum sojae]